MSDTPRTDKASDEANEIISWSDFSVHILNCSRQLERELNASLDALKKIGDKHDKELNAANERISRMLDRQRECLRDYNESKLELNAAMKELDEANAALGDMRSAMAAHMAVCGKTLEWAYCEGMNDMENSRGRTTDELWEASETKRMAEGKEKK